MTSIKVPRNTLKEMLDSLDELALFSEDSSIDLNILTKDDSIYIYVRVPSVIMVHEILSSEDVDVDIGGDERICLNPNLLLDVVTKAEKGVLELEFRDTDYVLQYDDEEALSEPLTMRLKQFDDSGFQALPEFSGLKRLGSLDRQTLFRSLDMMGAVSPMVKVMVKNSMLSLEVEDQVSGEGEVSPKITNPEVEEFEEWYSIDPLISFLRKITSGDEVNLLVTPDDTLVVEVESSDKISRLYLAERVDTRYT